MRGQGYQLLRVDLTSSPLRGGEYLSKDYKKLRRRVEREFKLKLHYVKIETTEGHGVLHLIWAIKSERAVWIPYEWLRANWLDIHGAYEVHIKRISEGKGNIKRVTKYVASQYLAGQSSQVRLTWSWWRDGLAIGRAWDTFKKTCRKCSEFSTWIGENTSTLTMSREEMVKGWNKLLEVGWWSFAELVFFISGRMIDIGDRREVVREVNYYYGS
jgi:hypothetical protein